MLKYILKRLLQMIPVLIGISFIIFAILDFTPGDPARIMLGASATEEDVASLREELGLNDNFFITDFFCGSNICNYRYTCRNYFSSKAI